MKKKPEYSGLLIVFLLVGISRRFAQLHYPNVWDEDGTQIIPGLLTDGLQSLFDPVNGYLVLVPKLVSFSSRQLSFYHYPLISSWLSFLVMALVGLAVAVSPTRLRAKRWCALAMFFIPSNSEVFGLPLYTFW